MEEKLLIPSKYKIPAVFTRPDNDLKTPTVILCHGTGSNKDEVGNIFVMLAEALKARGIASIRFDFAGSGERKARMQDYTFYGAVSDTEAIYKYLCNLDNIDSGKIGILGFSQGARVMAEFLGKYPGKIKAAVSWSGACHNGEGVFGGWFKEYYEEASNNGYARIPLFWRDDLLLSKTWFDEIRASNPLVSLSKFKGALLAISGREDELVPYMHAEEIANASGGKVKEYKIILKANHTFNILEKDKSLAKMVLEYTADWIKTYL
ncbi:MAG TPA: alpha/beta fold hydrolase [Acholeplasmataceae bacterium]|nr:alpha/beta fold hydrolase [Acholeplasmataceae bacterium]